MDRNASLVAWAGDAGRAAPLQADLPHQRTFLISPRNRVLINEWPGVPSIADCCWNRLAVLEASPACARRVHSYLQKQPLAC